jgi:hypothetical protein
MLFRVGAAAGVALGWLAGRLSSDVCGAHCMLPWHPHHAQMRLTTPYTKRLISSCPLSHFSYVLHLLCLLCCAVEGREPRHSQAPGGS